MPVIGAPRLRVPNPVLDGKRASGPSCPDVAMRAHRGSRSRRSNSQTIRRAVKCTAGARVARYYDPSTAQFLTRDPLEAQTHQPYQYAASDPLDLSDPSGLCIGPEVLCRAANDIWHPVRFAATLPVSATARAVDAGYELFTDNDVSCHWNSAEWVDVCTGGPTILNAPATTFGSAVNTQMSYCDFMSANDGRLIAHEAKHSDQWAIFGPGFAVLDTVASGVGWGVSKVKGGNPGQYNIFEIWAGLKDGGYK